MKLRSSPSIFAADPPDSLPLSRYFPHDNINQSVLGTVSFSLSAPLNKLHAGRTECDL